MDSDPRPGYVRTETDEADWRRHSHASRIRGWIGGASHWNRRRKFELFLRELAPTSETTVLDVGFSEAEFQRTANYIEKHYPWPAQITALGTDEPDTFRTRYPEVRAVHYDGAAFPFAADQFDVVWSNAVVEHVGDAPNQLRFLSEIRRVGRRAFVTTPNRYFPIEVHTRTPLLHFLPKPVFDTYLRRRGLEWATEDYMWLLGRREFAALLRRAGFDDVRIVANRIGPFAVDFVAIAS